MPRARLPRLPLPVVAGAIAGLALRMVIWFTPLGRSDSDEVLSALMVRHLTDGGGIPLFVWGQHYGGTVELLPLWVSLHVFGFDLVGLRVPNLLFAALNAWVLYRLARRSMAEPAAQLAGVLLWTGPAAAVWFGVHEQLFYPQTTAFGLVALLLAHRIGEHATVRDALALGLALGVGWWTSPSILYFAIPAAAVLVVARRRAAPNAGRRRGIVDVRIAGLVAVAALAGAAPWLFDAVTNDWAPLHATSTFPTLGTFPTRLAYLVTRSLAGALGARTILSHDWAWGPVGVVVHVALLGVLCLGWWRAARSWSWDAVGLVAFAVIYAAIPFSPDDPNLRYTFYAAPFLASVVARAVGTVTVTKASAVLAASVLLTSASLYRLHDLSEHGGTVYRVGNVPELDGVIAVLDAHDITRVWGDYWVAYRLVFETDERIISSPAAGIPRYPPYADEVRAAARTAWVALRGPQSVALVAALDELQVPFRSFDAGDFVVVVPIVPIQPEHLPEPARRAPETPRPVL